MVKCTINGVEVEVEKGTTIIEAFNKIDHDIAHYCWHPGLTVAGVCRLCMVEIEGIPKLQIACNTEIKDGMVITNQSEKVKDTVRWGMDFHLINHPLDCPICDQAGECGLQEQYMKFGKYVPEMAEHKVKKHKVVDLGPKIVLDSERCILCSRCVRFTAEVSKTFELGIFNRGDRSEIGTFENKPLDNNYSMNTVDICPVGALTSKDFRFRQRVWYLQNADTICTGCSTGCNVKAYYNEEGLFRVKPVYNEKVNGHWMCDEGRDVYKFVNRPNRLTVGRVYENHEWQTRSAGEATQFAGEWLKAAAKADPQRVALVLTGQHTNEEYQAILDYFVGELKAPQVYHWLNHPEQMDAFDGILLRGDRNPNTKGLRKQLADKKIDKNKWSELEEKLNRGDIDLLLVVAPENPAVFSDIDDKIPQFLKAKSLIWMSSAKTPALDQAFESSGSQVKVVQIPLKTYAEKAGTFTNFSGLEQKVKPILTVVAGALSVSDATLLLKGDPLPMSIPSAPSHIKTNFFTRERGAL